MSTSLSQFYQSMMSHPMSHPSTWIRSRTWALRSLLVATAALAVSANVATAQPRIVGGTQSDPDAYPWMAAVVQSAWSDTYYGQFCGGSLIAPNWVLTAAHCVEDSAPRDIDMVIGASLLGQTTDGDRHNVSRIIPHPDYARTGTPDLALVRLSSSSDRSPVNLVTPGSSLAQPNSVARVIGWGVTSEDGSATRRLREANIPIVSQAVCENAYGDIDQADEICAGLTTGGRDACFGDSGGPLFVRDASGSGYLQAGIVSWGEGCARPGLPGVYARVSTHYDWINEMTDNALGRGVPASGDVLTAAFRPECDGRVCDFNAVSSTPGAYPIETYWWNFGDGEFETGRSVRHTFDNDGTYNVTLFVIDESGDRDDRVKEIIVSDDPAETVPVWTGSIGSDKSIAVPGRAGFWANDGKLKAVLRHSGNIDLDLKLQKYDDAQGKWKVIEVASTDGKKEVIRMQPAASGMYRLKVLSRGSGGDYELTVLHQ